MASTASVFWQTLVAATSQLNETLTGTNALLKHVWKDVKPAQTALGQTLTINIPANVESQVTNAPLADPTFNEFSLSQVSLAFDKKPQYGTIVRSFEQFNSPQDILDVLLVPGIQAVARAANGYLAALCVTGNFARTTAVATTGSAITTTQFLGGQQQLIENLVDVQAGPDWLRFIQAPAPFTKMMGDASWASESVVGINQAQDMRVSGAPRAAFGAGLMYDQSLPATGTSPNKTYTSFYGTRTAIAAAFRPLPSGDEGAKTTYMMVDGIPIRIMLSFQHLKDAHVLSIDTGMGCAVVRPEQAVLFTTAQS